MGKSVLHIQKTKKIQNNCAKVRSYEDEFFLKFKNLPMYYGKGIFTTLKHKISDRGKS